MAITFTNKAAEMRDVDGLGRRGDLGQHFPFELRSDSAPVWPSGIWHEFTIWRRRPENADEAGAQEKRYDPKQLRSGRCCHGFLRRENDRITADEFEQQAERLEKIAWFTGLKELKKNNALDFDDLLVKTVELLRQTDAEYQDKFGISGGRVPGHEPCTV